MTYRRGSSGPEITLLQGALRTIGYYSGPIDGVFGGGTESAVRRFQLAAALPDDGIVDATTWMELVGVGITTPVLASRPLPFRVLALSASFETSLPPPECFAALSGDIDGQGLCLGALAWSLGRGSLQPLLHEMLHRHGDVLREALGPHGTELSGMLHGTRRAQLAWARSIQSRRHGLVEPWRGLFKTLARTPELRSVQEEAATALYHEALRACGILGVVSERAVALVFDVLVQEGSLRGSTAARILADPGTPRRTPHPDAELPRLAAIARRRADAADPRCLEDVRARTSAIATGQGMVRGSFYDLASSYGITLAPAPPGGPVGFECSPASTEALRQNPPLPDGHR